MTTCDQVTEDLAALADGDRDAIARHAEHLASCDACRDARHEASQLASLIATAGADFTPSNAVDRLLEAIDRPRPRPVAAPAPVPVPVPVPVRTPVVAAKPAKPAARRRWLPTTATLATLGALAAAGTGVYVVTRHSDAPPPAASDALPAGAIGRLATISRAAADHADGVHYALATTPDRWLPLRGHDALPAGARIQTDERTRAQLALADGTQLVLDHATTIAFDPGEPRRITLSAGRLLADVAHLAARPAQVTTPSGTIDVIGTKFVTAATDAFTSVQVVRGEVALHTPGGDRDEVRAGEEGTIDQGKLAVSPAPQLARDVEWAELVGPTATADETTAGLGSLRAYKPGESRDRDWNLALASHDVKVRIVGPIARTEITETFRNDSAAELEGVYQFPLPPDAQIDGLALDSKDGFTEGAFVDKQRGAKIWTGVIAKAAPKMHIAKDEIIWVDGRWRDPALLDWQRGGRFELKVFPIPPKGQRTIKLAYTQVVAARGAWREYVYPLPHSSDGSTVADQMSVDVEIRGGEHGAVRTLGYALHSEARGAIDALTMHQAGFVPRGDLVVAYRAADGTAELRAWSYAGSAAVAPDPKLATKKGVGIDPKVIDAQRAIAADGRPTAVLALRPSLPRWKTTRPRDYVIVLDDSQSMVGERFARAGELAQELIAQLDRRDRFSVMTCDSECRSIGDLRPPTAQAAADVKTWLAGQTAAGSTDVVASVRAARAALGSPADREGWVLYIGDGFASTGFRRAGDIEHALAGSPTHLTTIAIGSDADSAALEAAARGGGGSYLAWLPGERPSTAALAALESSYGSVLENATVELPGGLADAAPTVLPTVRAGDELLVAARVTGDVRGDVIVKGTVAGQPFEQHYPLHLELSTAPGNRFVPRLWASLAIAERERAGTGEDRAQIVALSQAYGVMSRETSLLVLESPAMFDAFGVDRHVPDEKWTGEDDLDEVATSGTLLVGHTAVAAKDATKYDKKTPAGGVPAADDGPVEQEQAGSATTATSAAPPAPPAARPSPAMPAPAHFAVDPGRDAEERQLTRYGIASTDEGTGGGTGGARISPAPGMIAMRKVWERVPAISPYDAVSPSITKAIADAERALAASPDSREKHRALVQALSYAGELERAEDVAAKWLDRDKLDPQALGYEADLLGRAGKRDLALRTLDGLTDLDADRAALHERMVQAYEQIGRLDQACSHRIAIASIDARDVKAAGAAMRCLRALGHHDDAELIARALPDDDARRAAEQAAEVAPPEPKLAGDFVAAAHWDHAAGADLDLSLVTPDGTRVSWMGGRDGSVVSDATSTEREQLAIKSLRRGNYLLEISRGTPSHGDVRGTVDLALLGARRSLPFTLVGDRTVVARVSVNLEAHYVTLDEPEDGTVRIGSLPDDTLQRVVMARSPSLRACYAAARAKDPSLRGTVTLTVTIEPGGGVALSAAGSAGMAEVAECVRRQLETMHTAGRRSPVMMRLGLHFAP